MPSSQFGYIKKVLKKVADSPHQSILDIGPGFGKYGVLCREYFDLIPTWTEKKLSGFDKKNWQIRIDCIEPFKPYITPLHEYIYDNIYPGKAEEVLPRLDNYDLILMIGVLEHLEKVDGLKLLKWCLMKAQSIVLVTPDGSSRQKAEWDNPYEEHRATWHMTELAEAGFKTELASSSKILAHWQRKK